MTISVWRYSHLALAVSSFIFMVIAAVTGIILSFEPINEKIPSYRADNFNQVNLATALPAIHKNYHEITELTVDMNQFVTVKGTDSSNENIIAYVDPSTGKQLGVPGKKNNFFQWVTALHRSLFLHETGRFFIGFTSFLLVLIALSGMILVIQRQRGVKRFFTRIVKENISQYYHVVLGRLSLIPILIIALTGTYLSLVKFGVFPEKKMAHQINFDIIKPEPQLQPANFAVFKNTLLSQVQSIEYPFSDDPEDYYTLRLKDREVVVNQFTGEILSEVRYPVTALLTSFSLDMHTGRKSILWSIVLGIASINILFFIYSGFNMTWKRIKNRTKNKYKATESRFIILVGSENGSTMGFAKAIHQQLINSGQLSFITQLNDYTLFPKAEHFIILTSTYGLGDAPSNANKFSFLVEKYKQTQPVHFSVVGFGSKAYPDFCQFAFEVNNILSAQSWATPLLEIHTVNDKSPEQFNQWLEIWLQHVALPAMALPASFYKKPGGLQTMTVTQRTAIAHEDGPFIIKLQAGGWIKFHSGDLLAIYPADDYRERLYSIGKIEKDIQLSVKLHPSGLGSSYLYNLAIGNTIPARIVSNVHFRFPQKAPAVVMICNGTGIAPFLGMIDQNIKKISCHLYCGFRGQPGFELYKAAVTKNIETQKLSSLHVAYSREGEKQYVKDLLATDADFIAATLANNGVLMLCGSLAMQNNVIGLLEGISVERTGKSISFYQSHGQVLMDCY
jgi:sulfite reductase (NADPH) flavoprotein alpha-component